MLNKKRKVYKHKEKITDLRDGHNVQVCLANKNELLFVGLLVISKDDALALADFIKRKFQ